MSARTGGPDTSTTDAPARSRWSPAAAAAVLLGPALLTTLLLVATGGETPLPGLPDPGAVTRIGLPAVQAVRDVAVLLALGLLAVALACVPPAPTETSGRLGAERRRLVDLAARALLLWASASLVLVLLSFSDASGLPLGETPWDQVTHFARSYDLGRYLLGAAVLAGLAGVVAHLASTPRVAGGAFALAVLATWSVALAAHGTGGLEHDLAVSMQFVHLLAVGVWGGGVVALAVVSRSLGERLEPTLRRFSSLATVSLVALAAAGVLGAWIRLPDLASLGTTYGAFLIAKIVLTLLVGLVGLQQRRALLGAFEPTRVRRLLLTETAVLLTTAGVAVALNRTPPPPRPVALNVAEDLLGFDLPGEPSFTDWFTMWRPDGFWGLLAVLAVVLYLLGVRRLRSRGDAWSVLRTIAWVLGWVMLLWATNGAPGMYGRFLFSVHMVQHMAIATTIPVLLVLGAPATLALRALPSRRDGSAGPREWVQLVLNSPPAAFFGHPLVAGGLFVTGLFAFYFTPLFEIALRTHTGHVLMTFHFLLTGYLFANVLVGIDPSPHRPSYPMRVVLTMAVFAMHSFFSVALMSTDQVLAADWFEQFPHDWGRSLADDQHLGASLGWALGEIPLLMLGFGLVAQWVRVDRAERRRFDRHEARTGDEALNAWNARFAALADHDSQQREDRD